MTEEKGSPRRYERVQNGGEQVEKHVVERECGELSLIAGMQCMRAPMWQHRQRCEAKRIWLATAGVWCISLGCERLWMTSKTLRRKEAGTTGRGTPVEMSQSEWRSSAGGHFGEM